MNLRRIRGRVGGRAWALGAAGIVATATLTACGFNYPTDQVSTLSAGSNYRADTINILNAAVVSKQANSGTFVATFVNGNPTKTISLQTVSGDNTAISNVQAKPFTLQPNTLRNLATQGGGFPVSGTFSLGQFVNLSFQFDNGQTVDFSVPVVLDDEQWAGLDTSTPSASASASASESPSATATASESPSP